MPLLDPKNIDVADLLSLLRDIGDQLDGISERLDGIEETLDSIETDTELHDLKLNALIATEPGHDRAVELAAQAVIADMADRQSLILVADDESEYHPRCTGCLLRKNGYPQLAQLLAAGDAGHED